MIPMVDLKKQFRGIKNEVLAVITEILQGSQYVLGKNVTAFERRTADYHHVKEAVGVASGTDALHLAIDALDIGQGDEVITTPFTFFATVEAILYTGAVPVFADIEPDTFNIDPDQIEAHITEKTRAILPVHLFGHPADMGKIRRIARKHRLKIVEDCAQCFGADINGKKAGSFGDAGCFSFYPSKNLGGYGDGGLIILNNKKVADTVRELRNHGSRGSYIHRRVGFNSRLDEIQAAILLIKMKHIDSYNKKRRQNARLYTELLSGSVTCPVERKEASHVYHQYTIMSSRREAIQQKLREKNISSVIYYPVPLHLQNALKFLGYHKGDFPVAEKVAKRVLSLPMYPELEESAVRKITHIIRSVV